MDKAVPEIPSFTLGEGLLINNCIRCYQVRGGTQQSGSVQLKKNISYEPIFQKHQITKMGLKIFKKSGNIFRTVTFERQELLDPVTVIALQFDRISLYRTATGEFAFHIF
jgi:hypothetical protein